jgi:hypothetical protein
MTKTARLKAERQNLLSKYDSAVEPQRAAVAKAYAKTRTPYNRFRRTAGKVSPTRLWKQSVLKYRPAWYVNNELYNTQAAVLAGGIGALPEKLRLLSPRRWREATANLPEGVIGNLSKEVGKDKLARVASRHEDWSRIAAFRAAKKQGYSDAEAIKRVNRYLFDYKTRNWERPIKAVVPFWQFNKNVAKASAVMPFDKPLAAKAYNQLDRYQGQQYNKDFDTLIPELKKLGYSDAEIEQFRKDNAKYYQGRLKVGGKYITTPFNAFSEKQMSQLGFNPFLAAAGETADSVDSFGRQIGGQDASWWRRLASKFPQLDLAIQAKQARDVQTGASKPHSSWIAKPGHEGYGLTKDKQGYDKSKTNYVSKLDPRAKLGQNALAFAGVPRGLEFNKDQFIHSKKLQKATESYFANTWAVSETEQPDKTLRYKQEQANIKKMLGKYGLTADSFFKGVLAKYDSQQTKQIKATKESAKNATDKLFQEYENQPKGTRNLWATNKLRELVSQGYFDKNPFLKSFDWITPTTVAKADKQALVLDALKTGDWSKYQAKFGLTQKQKDYQYAASSGDWSKWRAKYGVKSDKAKAYILASSTGDWSKYKATYGTKQSPYQYAGKFFKSAESMQKYKDGEFWAKYAAANKTERKQLLAANPKYNTRADWTASMWTAWKNDQKAKQKTDFATLAGFNSKLATNKTAAQNKAGIFLSAHSRGYRKKIAWKA